MVLNLHVNKTSQHEGASFLPAVGNIMVKCLLTGILGHRQGSTKLSVHGRWLPLHGRGVVCGIFESGR